LSNILEYNYILFDKYLFTRKYVSKVHSTILLNTMAKYAWYTRLSDTLHRLTVLTLVGGSLYMSGGLVYTLYMNGRRYEDKVTTPPQKQIEGSASNDGESKSTTPAN